MFAHSGVSEYPWWIGGIIKTGLLFEEILWEERSRFAGFRMLDGARGRTSTRWHWQSSLGPNFIYPGSWTSPINGRFKKIIHEWWIFHCHVWWLEGKLFYVCLWNPARPARITPLSQRPNQCSIGCAPKADEQRPSTLLRLFRPKHDPGCIKYACPFTWLKNEDFGII